MKYCPAQNIKNTDIHRQLHFQPFSKTYVTPINVSNVSKLTSFAKNIYEDNYCYNDGNSFDIKKDLNITSGDILIFLKFFILNDCP